VKEGVRLSYVYKSGEDLFVSSDRHIVELVLNKLVVCACKFTPKGEVGVGYEYEKNTRRLTFFVQDTGVGIPEERKKSLFKWFDTPDSQVEETEFDLSVAQRLAEKVGGYLRLDESFTEGTRMEFVLPVR
jgi:signal transduction histidine kinase